MKKILENDIFRRSIKTFLQAFMGSLLAFINENATFDKKMLLSAIIAALSSAFCALMNYIINYLDKEEE